MGIISKIFHYDNIGKKIKDLAKWSCWITILLLWIAAVILIIVAMVEGGLGALLSMIVFPIAALISSFSIWIGSWAMYAFGELVDKTCDNEHNTRVISEKLNKKDTPQAAKAKCETEAKAKRTAEQVQTAPPVSAPKAEENVVNEFSNDYWICGKCKTKNLATRSDCWSCGNSK